MNLCLVNGWLVYKRQFKLNSKNEKTVNSHDFAINVSNHLLFFFQINNKLNQKGKPTMANKNTTKNFCNQILIKKIKLKVLVLMVCIIFQIHKTIKNNLNYIQYIHKFIVKNVVLFCVLIQIKIVS